MTALSVITSWGALMSALGMLLLLGAGPVLLIRCVAFCYPRSHSRRAELLAEMHHVTDHGGPLRRWVWLGQLIGLGLVEGVPLRAQGLWRSNGLRYGVDLAWDIAGTAAIVATSYRWIPTGFDTSVPIGVLAVVTTMFVTTMPLRARRRRLKRSHGG